MYQKMTSEVIYYDDSLGKKCIIVCWLVCDYTGRFLFHFLASCHSFGGSKKLFKVLENFLLEEFGQVG